MVNRRSKQPLLSSHVTLIVLAATTLPSVLMLQTIVARVYYDLNSQRLRVVASMAVKAGAEYLPRYPSMAVLMADRYARYCGIAPSEIISTDVSADGNTLTIKLSRQVPEYVSLLAFGLRDRMISVTAYGQLQKFRGGSRRSAPAIKTI